MPRTHAIALAAVAGLLVTLSSCRPADSESADPAAATPDLPTLTAQSSPNQVAAAFVQALEGYLLNRQTNRPRADAYLTYASKLIGDQAVVNELRRFGLKIEQIDPVRYSTTQKEVAAEWSSAINFYAGYIEYPTPQTQPTTAPATEAVRFAAHNPAYNTRPVQILVVVTPQDNTWKVRLLTLMPAQNPS